MNDEIIRSMLELRDWFLKNDIDPEGLEVVIKAPARAAYFADQIFKRDLQPGSFEFSRHGIQIAGINVRFEKID